MHDPSFVIGPNGRSCLDPVPMVPTRDRITHRHIDIVFDGPPSAVSGRFVEVEDSSGRSIDFGEWIQRPDGYWVLRIPDQRLSEGK